MILPTRRDYLRQCLVHGRESRRSDARTGSQPAVRLRRGNGGVIARRSLKSFPYGDIANATFATVILLNCKCPRPRL